MTPGIQEADLFRRGWVADVEDPYSSRPGGRKDKGAINDYIVGSIPIVIDMSDTINIIRFLPVPDSSKKKMKVRRKRMSFSTCVAPKANRVSG